MLRWLQAYSKKVVSPVGKLKVCNSYWQDAEADEYMLDFVFNGYKRSFVNLPDYVIMRNNKSALANSYVVEKEILSLFKKRLCAHAVNQT